MMTKYPCPPVGFQFTEENVLEAMPFYSLWLLQYGIHDAGFLRDADNCKLFRDDFRNLRSLPWTVRYDIPMLMYGTHFTFTKTPLPEGETHVGGDV